MLVTILLHSLVAAAAPEPKANPPIIDAVLKDDVALAGKLIAEKKAGVDDRDPKRELTPLMWAVNGGQVKMVETLIAHGADVNATDVVGQTPLFFVVTTPMRPERAITLKQARSIIKLLVKAGADVSAPMKQVGGLPGGITPLRLATAGNIEMMKVLLEAGANPNAADSKGITPLMAAVDERWGQNSDAQALPKVKLLLEHGAMHDLAVNSLTPLMVALWGGFVECAKVLVAHGASTTGTSNNGTTMLMFASRSGWLDLVKQLLGRGDDVNARNNAGDTPLLMALGDWPYRPNPPAGIREVVQELLARGAEVKVVNALGQTPLMLAARNGDLVLFDRFFESDKDMLAVDHRKSTLLMHAAAGGNVEIVKRLLAAGLSARAADNDGDTAMHWAAARGRTAVMDHLIVGGAEVNVVNKSQQTPLVLAVDCTNAQAALTVKKLLSLGARPEDAVVRAKACQNTELSKALESALAEKGRKR